MINTLLQACYEKGQVIDQAYRDGHGIFHDGEPVDGMTLLWAISGNESTFGDRRLFVRNEPVYMPGGRYYKQSVDIRRSYYKWGILACSSFGAFQVMHPTAHELGFREHPIDLQTDMVCAHYATKLIIDRIVKHQGASTLAQVLDAYNSGSFRDRNMPERYIADGIAHYEKGLPTSWQGSILTSDKSHLT